MAALTRRGHAVRPFKVGPDYIDPLFHQAATGRTSRNLDSWLLPEQTLVRLFCRELSEQGERAERRNTPAPASVAVIEGVMGLFDGQGEGPHGSTAHVASLLKSPVVLLINGEGLSLSAAALVSGYANFRPHPSLNDLHVAAVLLNRLSGPAHYTLLRRCIEQNTGIPCLGWLPKNAAPPLPRRHLGLVPANELRDLAGYLDTLAEAAEKTLDISGLLELARTAPPLRASDQATQRRTAKPPAILPPVRKPAPVRIGLARDEAFSFYYQDNLDLLQRLGAFLVPFSPLRDKRLPPRLDGLYLGGGFPEVFAAGLERNAVLRAETANALRAGLPTYAECGGMLYLCSSLRPLYKDESAGQQRFAMVDFFPEQAEMTSRLQPFGYVAVTLNRNSLIGPAGFSFRAHEFHYARLLPPDAPERPSSPALTVTKADGRAWSGGLCRKNVLALFPHLHFHACPQAAELFLATCRRYSLSRKGGV